VAAAVAETAAAWDAAWSPGGDGGRLELPVVFGLRRGVVSGALELTGLGEARTRVVFTPESSRLEVERAAVAVLSFAAIPLVVTVAWPFWPALFPLVPFAAVTGLVAWWLVVSRLRSRGPEEFLAALAERLTAGGGGESAPDVIR
jgi:hypothetical protein